MNSDTQQILAAIYAHLPLYAEEGGEFSVVSVQTLMDVNRNHPSEAVTTAIQLVQRLLQSLTVLDESYIRQNQWRFTSFPASLLGRSAVQCLADDQQRLFAAEFWLTSDSSSPVSERQRNVLHAIETKRQAFHPNSAKPVRYVHVAWGLIVLDGKVLLRHREDRNRPDSSNYVLVGGRLSQNDLRQAGESNPIKVLQDPGASDNAKAMRIALTRELQEETELMADVHYAAELWHTIKPYRAVEGAGANHALTEYRIQVYRISLNRSGLFRLLQSVQEDPALVWFSPAEFLSARSADGKMAYLDALIEDFASPLEWQTWASALPQSYQENYQFSAEHQSVTIPLSETEMLETGRTGKESPVPFSLTDFQKNLLAGLAAVSGKYDFEASAGVMALGGGWIKLEDQYLIQETRKLASLLAATDWPLIQSANECFFRLNVAPEFCYFSDTGYTFSIRQKRLTLTRQPLRTPFGLLQASASTVQLSANLARDIEGIAAGDPALHYQEEDFNKLVRRDIRPVCQRLGLRTLVRTVAKQHVIKLARDQV